MGKDMIEIQRAGHITASTWYLCHVVSTPMQRVDGALKSLCSAAAGQMVKMHIYSFYLRQVGDRA